MLAKKINITKFISKDEFNTIKQYSVLLSDAYNLALTSLKQDLNFKNIHQITKNFQHKNKTLYSKHAQNVGRECINAVKSYLSLKKVDKNAKFPKNYRSLSPITLDTNIQIIKNKKYICGRFHPKWIKY